MKSCFLYTKLETHYATCQISKMKLFAKIVNMLKPVNYFHKYVSDYLCYFFNFDTVETSLAVLFFLPFLFDYFNLQVWT